MIESQSRSGSQRTRRDPHSPPHLAADRRRCTRGRPQAESPLRAIRDKCLDCSCYQVSEVRLCEAVKCPLWPFRAGRHPWWGEGEKTCQTLANSERQTAFQDEGFAPGSASDAERIQEADRVAP